MSHADKGTINMKHINVIFDRRPVYQPLGGVRVWGQKVKIQLFQNTVMLHIKLKRITNAAANILPADPYPSHTPP